MGKHSHWKRLEEWVGRKRSDSGWVLVVTRQHWSTRADVCCKEEFSTSPGHMEAITGSGSLLPSSESDSWGVHHASQWKADSASPTLSSSHTNHSSSPMRGQSSNQLLPQSFPESNAGNSSYFGINPGANMAPSNSNKPPRKPFPDPTSGSFVASNIFDPARSSRHNSEEENRYSAKALNLGGSDMGYKIPPARHTIQNNLSGYDSSAVSRSGSLPPSRNGVESSRFGDDAVNPQYAQLGPPGTTSHRQNLSTHTSSTVPQRRASRQRFENHSSPTQLGVLAGDFNKMDLGRENQNLYFAPQKEVANANNTFTHDYSHQLASNDTGDSWSVVENEYPVSHEGYLQDGALPSGLLPHPSHYRGIQFGATYAHSPSNSDARRSQQTPFYSAGGTPPSGMQHRRPKGGTHVNGVPNGDAALLDRKLRGLQQEQQGYPSQPNPLQFRLPCAPSYEFHPQNTLRMNPLAPFYHVPTVPNLLPNPTIPRGPAREHDVGQHVRSALLEEFRTSGKTNKRYELKVNHGSRSRPYCPSLNGYRIFTTTSLNSVVTSMARDSFSKNWRRPTATKRIKFFARSIQIHYS